jgi:hypothetical protein
MKSQLIRLIRRICLSTAGFSLLLALACSPSPPEGLSAGTDPGDPSSGMSFQAFYETFNSLPESSPEKQQFIADCEGRQVTWEGYVLDIAEFGPEETTVVLMAVEFTPDDLAYFHFDNEWQQTLYDFDQHDRIRITGTFETFNSAPKLKGTSASRIHSGP